MMLNQVNYGGAHLLYTLVDKDGMENHPLIKILRMVMPRMEIDPYPLTEYTVVKAVTDVDMWEIVLIRHDFPHDDPAAQKFCDARPYQIIYGGEIHFNPIDDLANWSMEEGHAEYQRLVDAAVSDGAHLKTLV